MATTSKPQRRSRRTMGILCIAIGASFLTTAVFDVGKAAGLVQFALSVAITFVAAYYFHRIARGK